MWPTAQVFVHPHSPYAPRFPSILSPLPPLDRYDVFCTTSGCYPTLYRDDVENPWPALWGPGVACAPHIAPDPRIPANVVEAWCGPAGCGPLTLPMAPARVLQWTPSGGTCTASAGESQRWCSRP